jgi:predicted dehydrogenase
MGETPTPPLSGALVGYGFIGSRGHVPAYAAFPEGQAPLRIVAVADTCAARRERAVADLPGVRVYETYAELLEREAGRIDFVDITTPPSTHAEVAHAALDRGLHVLCEKPLTTTTAEARSLLDHARRARRVIFPCHNYKHAPVIKTVRRILDSGAIGPVSLVTLHTFRNTHARGVAEWRPDWRRERRFSGGGIAMDHGSHTFYLAFDWLGTFPTAISARMSTLVTQASFDTEDNLACSIQFPNGTASAHLSWTAGMRRVIYTLHGDRGAIRVEDDDVETVTSHTRADGSVAWETQRERVASDWMDASHTIWFRSLLEQFSAAIVAGDFAGKEAETALRCIELITTAYASAEMGSRELPLGTMGDSVTMGDPQRVPQAPPMAPAPMAPAPMASVPMATPPIVPPAEPSRPQPSQRHVSLSNGGASL